MVKDSNFNAIAGCAFANTITIAQDAVILFEQTNMNLYTLTTSAQTMLVSGALIVSTSLQQMLPHGNILGTVTIKRNKSYMTKTIQ